MGSWRGALRPLRLRVVPQNPRARGERPWRRLPYLRQRPASQGRRVVRQRRLGARWLRALAHHSGRSRPPLRRGRGDDAPSEVSLRSGALQPHLQDQGVQGGEEGDSGSSCSCPSLAVTFANEGEAPVPGEPIREEHGNHHGRTRHTCRLVGECNVGCNFGSKNTLDYNDLSEAKRLGADLRTGCEVETIEPREGSGDTPSDIWSTGSL